GDIEILRRLALALLRVGARALGRYHPVIIRYHRGYQAALRNLGFESGHGFGHLAPAPVREFLRRVDIAVYQHLVVIDMRAVVRYKNDGAVAGLRVNVLVD